MNSKIIEVSNLSKIYTRKQAVTYSTFREHLIEKISFKNKLKNQEFYALNNLSFTLAEGETLGVIGNNGAGKSTLLKILSKITLPSAGKVILQGKVASLLEVGTGFHPELTGRENVYFNGAILGMKKSEIKKKFDEIVDFSGVSNFIDNQIKFYSSGMQLRLAFAVAAHLDPEILIIDEVLAVGDIAFQQKCMQKMSEVSRSGRTIIFVSHNLAAVQKLCTRSIYINKGSLVLNGKSEDVIKEYTLQNTQTEKQYSFNLDLASNYKGYLNTIQLINKSRNDKLIFVGDQWSIQAEIILQYDIDHFIFGVGMKNALGVAVNTSYSEPLSLKKGKYLFEFYNDKLLFEAGNYEILIGLSTFESTFFYKEGVINFTINDSLNNLNNNRIIRTKGIGIILNQMQYSFNQI